MGLQMWVRVTTLLSLFLYCLDELPYFLSCEFPKPLEKEGTSGGRGQVDRARHLPLVQRVTPQRSPLGREGLSGRGRVHSAQTAATCASPRGPAQLGGHGGGARGRGDA